MKTKPLFVRFLITLFALILLLIAGAGVALTWDTYTNGHTVTTEGSLYDHLLDNAKWRFEEITGRDLSS